MARSKRDGRVYVIEAVGTSWVKIGWTRDTATSERLRALQVASPLELRLVVSIVGGEARERAMHEQFAEYRVRGEWFERRGRLAAWIERQVAEVEKQMSAVGV